VRPAARIPFLVLSLWRLGGQAAPQGVLDLRVTAGGKPAAARIYITDESGRPRLIPGAVVYSVRGEEHSIVERGASVALPPGKYRVRAEKGIEFRAVEKTISVTAGENAAVDLEIPRFHDMNERGWYSGDLHIHRSPAEMPLLVRAEELNIAPVITRHLGDGRTPPAYPEEAFLAVDKTHIIGLQNQEVERLGKGRGAVLLLNTPAAIAPSMTPLFPPDMEFCRKARAQNGFIDAEKPIWKNVPVAAALGALDSIGIVNNHFHPHSVLVEAEKWGSMERDRPAYRTPSGFAQWMMDLYYSFLNCGFRIPVSAGSASGIMPTWPGYERVYVNLSGAFGYAQWFADLRSGRSIATNGPLLEVYLNGQPPGAQAAWEGPAGATVAVEAHSQERLDRVEIVYNGEVIRAFPAGGNAVFHAALNVTITEPGWLAVRCFEAAAGAVRYAHSSPFYFLRDGKLPVKRGAALRWAEFIRRLAAKADAADYPSREAYEQAQAELRKAEEEYRRLAQ
jgi:hypothetical protein